MQFIFDTKSLTAKQGNETLQIMAWGNNALRIRSTVFPQFTGENRALQRGETQNVSVVRENDGARITNGKISAFVHNNGWLAFYCENKLLLKEYYRDFSLANPHSPSMKLKAREFKPFSGGGGLLTVRFEAQPQEKFFGMGQYQQPNLNLKGCVLELAQRNSQISVPFYLSNLGYGFLWNLSGVGEAVFGENMTQWRASCTDEMDYWITADDTPKKIIANFTEVVGRAPLFPDSALGLWQSKLRYRTQEEVLSVAREYYRRGIPLDYIVIDFFHWVRQGDWSFDPEYFPDPKAMTDELHSMGTKCMVSVWPTVDRHSVNFSEMLERGLLVRTERGSMQCFDFQGDTVIYDATNPEARNFLWEKLKKNYYDYGIDGFWLDEAEPEFAAYDYEHFRYYIGSDLKAGNCFPLLHTKGVYDGLRCAGEKEPVSLVRSAWVGSQKYAAVVWSGDIYSNFSSLRDQLSGGLNIGLAGIPWWTTDTGGFFGDVTDPGFNELLVRWFAFSAFSPVLRLHGDRGPHDIPNLAEGEFGGGFSPTGRDNELWSYGEEVYKILKKFLDICISMKSYLKEIMREASENGSPVMRTLFYEFPEDEICWEIADEYMLGSRYLVAPVLYGGIREREVYLPKGKWRHIFGNRIYETGRYTVSAPLDEIPVFERIG